MAVDKADLPEGELNLALAMGWELLQEPESAGLPVSRLGTLLTERVMQKRQHQQQKLQARLSGGALPGRAQGGPAGPSAQAVIKKSNTSTTAPCYLCDSTAHRVGECPLNTAGWSWERIRSKLNSGSTPAQVIQEMAPKQGQVPMQQQLGFRAPVYGIPGAR